MTRSAEDNKHARAGQREDAKHAPAACIRRAARLLRLRRGRNIRRVSPVVDPSKIERIWIRVPNWLGDFVMATASFERIRAAFPRAHITAGMRPYLRLMALTVIAYLWSRVELVAREKAGDDDANSAYLEGKQFSARFYFDKILPETEALLRDITSGKGSMMELEESHWAA